MKNIITTAASLIILCMFITGVDFRLYPFKFKLNSWQEFLGWIFLIISAGIIAVSWGKREYKRGYDEATNDFIEYAKGKSNEK